MTDTAMKESEAQREEQISKHRGKLKTPAIYALEVFITKAVIEPKFVQKLPDLSEDVEPRFKFMHFASVKLNVKGPEEDTSSTDNNAKRHAESDEKEPAVQPPSTDSTATDKHVVAVGSEKPSEASAVSDKPPESATVEQEVKEETTGGPEDEKDVCGGRINCNPDKMKDPNYFDPTRLLKKMGEKGDEKGQGEPSKPEPTKPVGTKPEESKAEAEKPEGQIEEGPKPEGSKQQGMKSEGSKPTGLQSEGPKKEIEETKPEEEAIIGDATKDAMGDQPDPPTIFVNDGKTIIFCMQPFELLTGLRRYPLTVSLTRPERQTFIGYSFLYVRPLVDAVDKSVSLTQSVPICGLLSGCFDLEQEGQVIGHIESDVRLHCFGPRFVHTINLPDNPNVKDQTTNSPDNLLVVAQISQAAMSKRRNPFSAKSRTEINEAVIRDINTCPPIISGDEFLPPTQPKTEPTLTVPENEEKERENLRVELLTKFPQYKCLPSWDVVFNRRLIKDLIAKNRRPFKQGSADRLYIEKYFPELLPDKIDQKKAVGKRSQKSLPDDKNQKLELVALDLADDWWASDVNSFNRKKKRAIKRQEKSITAISTTSIAHNLVGRDINRMQPSAWSRVALFKFDPDIDEDVKDSRIDLEVKPLSSTSIRPSETSSGGKQKNVFVVRSPQLDETDEGFDPVPEQPLAFAMNLPWKTTPQDVVNDARRMGAEVDAIGGDTKEFYRKPKEDIPLPKSKLPEHLDEISRGGKTMPLATPVVTLQIERGVPVAVPVRATPYWEGHINKCLSPSACNHFVLLHPGYGFYGSTNN